MPRALRRAAVLGATAHAAKRRGAAQAEEQMAAQAPPAAPAAPAAPVAPAAPAAASMDVKADELTKLKGLLDSGILTQEEFDAQKQQILAS